MPPLWLNVGVWIFVPFGLGLNLTSFVAEFLQERLTHETTYPEFSQLPFRFAEIAKVLLDVYVPCNDEFATTLKWIMKCTGRFTES